MQRNRTRKIITALLHAASFALLAGPAHSAFATDADYIGRHRLVYIGGVGKYHQHLNLYCVGSGSPTVVFESGIADWGFTWALVHPHIATMTQACVYDRAGLGNSDAARRASTSDHMVDDLHRLLQAAHLAPPYVLVGHSLGGLNVRLYADRFLSEVAGIVLVDPTHEDGIRRIDAQKNNQESQRYAAEVARARGCLFQSVGAHDRRNFRRDCIEPDDPHYSAALNAERVRIEQRPSFQRAQLSELTHYADGTSFADVRNARRWYGMLPLVVLSASETIDRVGPEWRSLHQELAMLSRLGVQCTVAASGHYIQLDQPQTVVAAVAAVVHRVRQAHPPAKNGSSAFDYTSSAHSDPAPSMSCPDQSKSVAPS